MLFKLLLFTTNSFFTDAQLQMELHHNHIMAINYSIKTVTEIQCIIKMQRFSVKIFPS